MSLAKIPKILTDLYDFLTSYTGAGGKYLRVKADETGVEAVTIDTAAIAHTNRTALDAVTGVNTGDQTPATITGFNAAALAAAPAETIATIKSALGITTLSGSNTGDQTLVGLGGAIASIVQSIGVVNTNYAVDFNSGLFATVTTGSGAATITMPDYASTAVSVTAWLYVTQGGTARTQTIGTPSGTNNNVVSSGGLMGAGDALPNSGATKTDAYQYTWTGAKWMLTNAIFSLDI